MLTRCSHRSHFRRSVTLSEQPFHTSCAPLAFTSSSVRLQKFLNFLFCGAASTVLFSCAAMTRTHRVGLPPRPPRAASMRAHAERGRPRRCPQSSPEMSGLYPCVAPCRQNTRRRWISKVSRRISRSRSTTAGSLGCQVCRRSHFPPLAHLPKSQD